MKMLLLLLPGKEKKYGNWNPYSKHSGGSVDTYIYIYFVLYIVFYLFSSPSLLAMPGARGWMDTILSCVFFL